MLCATLNLRILYRHWQAGRGPEKESPLAVLDSSVKAIWPNPKSTRALVAEAIGLGRRA
jgi:hypothetical protein